MKLIHHAGQSEKGKGITAIALCALLWSTSGLLIKLIPWNPLAISGARSFIAFLFILIVRFIEKPKKFGNSRMLYRILGAISYGATMILFVLANKLTSSANVILLQYIAPVWAALLGWLLIGEKPKGAHWAALGAVAVGLVIFFKDSLFAGPGTSVQNNDFRTITGNIIAIISGITFALYSVFMRLEKDGRPEDTILFAHLGTALFCLPFFLIQPPRLSPVALGSVLGLGIFQIGLASLLFAYGIRRVTAVQSMLIALIEPVMNPVWVFLVTGERPGPATLAGGTVILTAVVLSSIWSNKGAS